MGLFQWLSGKGFACNAGASEDTGSNPWVGKILCMRVWQPTPLILPGEFPWTEEPGELQPTGSQRVGHDLSDLEHILKFIFTFIDFVVFPLLLKYNYS